MDISNDLEGIATPEEEDEEEFDEDFLTRTH